jgi:hypothetical protein
MPRYAALPIAVDTILDPPSIALHCGLEHWWDNTCWSGIAAAIFDHSFTLDEPATTR